MTKNPSLGVENLAARRGAFRIEGLSLTCRADEYSVLLGPTGCGKSTLLRVLLGLIPLQAGTIRLADRDLAACPIEARRLGYLPQHQYLFPHLDVEANILFGARRGEDRRALFKELGEPLGIGPLLRRSVANLSGGERQKVALARALAARPQALLLDEPFSAIDEGARRELWFDLRRVVAAARIPCLHVTHNLDEAYTLGDRVSVMIEGRLIQAGAPSEILARPVSEAVARFLGYRNLFRGRAEPHPLGCTVDCDGFRVVAPVPPPSPETVVCIRPQDVKIIIEGKPIREELAANVFAAEIGAMFRLPDLAVLRLRLADGGTELEMRLPPNLVERLQLKPGKRVRIGIWTPAVLVYPQEAIGLNIS